MRSTQTLQLLILLLVLTTVAKSQSVSTLTTNLYDSAPIERGETLEYFRRGMHLSRDRKFEESAKAFEGVIKLKPNLCDALAVFKRIEESDDPYGFETYYILGLGYGLARKFEKSFEAYRNALLLKWDDVPANYGLATSYLAAGNKAEALKVYEILKGLDAVVAERLLEQINKRK